MLVSFGLLMDHEVKISKQPTIFPLDSGTSAKPRTESAFELTALSDNKKAEFLWGSSSTYDCPIDVDSTIIVIDTETYLPVPKKVCFENGEYMAKITVQSGRSYFAFQIRPEMLAQKTHPCCHCQTLKLLSATPMAKVTFPKM